MVGCRCAVPLTTHLLWKSYMWWRHEMETFSALLAFCAGNSLVTGEFPAQRPATRSYGVLFDLRPNKRLGKQSWDWWFETLSRPLWRHCNDLNGGTFFTLARLCVLIRCVMGDNSKIVTMGIFSNSLLVSLEKNDRRISRGYVKLYHFRLRSQPNRYVGIFSKVCWDTGRRREHDGVILRCVRHQIITWTSGASGGWRKASSSDAASGLDSIRCQCICRTQINIQPMFPGYKLRHFVKYNLIINGWGISREFTLKWLPQDLSDDKSTLVQVMGGAIRQQAITWANVDPDLCRHMASLGIDNTKYFFSNYHFPNLYSRVLMTRL